jgi:hypothetical protein
MQSDQTPRQNSEQNSEQSFNPKTLEPTGVQHDRETPIPQKPSFLFITSISLGVLLIIVLAASSYYGIGR